MFFDPVAAAMKQNEFDFSVAPAAGVSKPKSSRLLILACSATKKTGDGLTALERYDGPLWQTLKAADPLGEAAEVAYLSAKYGVGRASNPMPDYNTLMTPKIAATMKQRGLEGYYPYDGREWLTAAGAARHAVAREKIRTIGGELVMIGHMLPNGFEDVAVCGGRLYVEVIEALWPQMLDAGLVAPTARLTVINDQIGYMRAALKAWLKPS